MSKLKTAVTFSRGIYKKENVKKLLNIDAFILKPRQYVDCSFVVGWGKKKNTQIARAYAKKHNLIFLALEDGFIHSMGQGVLGADSCSLVKDKTGIYYDATQASDLEAMLLNNTDFNKEKEARVKRAINRITYSHITKYNNAPERLPKLLEQKQQHTVLLIDQTAGDMSLEYGYIGANTFNNMLQAALEENPNSRIFIKTHPDVIAGKKKGCFDLGTLDQRVSILSEPVNPLVLLKQVDLVYVGTSQMGFEALLLGKQVVCFGVPFYAGWGLTDDRADPGLAVWKRRNKKCSIEALFAAAYIDYSSYIHPDDQQLCDLEEILGYFELQHKQRSRLAGVELYGINFTRWKRKYIQSFLKVSPPVTFVNTAEQAVEKGFSNQSQLVSWASKDQTGVATLVAQFGGSPWLVEDGLIRSAGLGTDLTAPASLVLDKRGIYYDPSQKSDLEHLLQNKTFSETELQRSRALIASLLANELSKYNLGERISKQFFDANPGQTLLLVPGQVEGDASIKKGCVDIKTNADLIKAVRQKEPDAYLIYKPHPDVVSGNRKGKVDKETLRLCNSVLMDASITDCLDLVDEVHTMTSLVGFEGLLRNKKVVCYGRPFYSGWGLTNDRHTVERRTRELSLDQLVTGTLIDYPLYINWQTGEFTTPEVIIRQLKTKIEQQGGKKRNQVFWLKRQARKAKNIVSGLLG